jgi:tRNA G18 (ribose-2'-O)-methylase SpoU
MSISLLRRARAFVKTARRRRAFEDTYRRGRLTARPGPHSVVVVLDHPFPERNPAATVRSADAFGARAVYVVGTNHFDPVPAVGSLANVPVRFFATFSEAHESLVSEGYTIFALEPARELDGPKLLHEASLPERTAFVIGNEKHGLSFRGENMKGVERLSIAQYGVVPCLNASVAASIALYEYARQHGKPSTTGIPADTDGDPARSRR